tara:strand:+ start:237 stop:827 length:591 start_codon:yes stop_codon:yes gene_type:complete
MVKKSFYIFGSGGHAKSCINTIESVKGYRIAGIIYKDRIPKDEFFNKYNLINESKLKSNNNKYYAIVGVGQIKSSLLRKKSYNYLKKKNFKLRFVKSSSSELSNTSVIGDGSIIMHLSYIGPNVKIGENCIINSGSIIEHDVEIGNHSHIAPGCIVNGDVKIQSDSFIGSGSVIKEGVTISSGSIIPMGSVIKKNV